MEEEVKKSEISRDKTIGNPTVISYEQVVLYFQFDDDKPIESIKCNGNEFTIKISSVEGGCIEFTDGNKRFRLFAKKRIISI